MIYSISALHFENFEGVFRTQANICDCKNSKPLNIFTESSIIDARLGSKYAYKCLYFESLLNYSTILYKVLFCNGIASVNKTKLDFNLILCNVFIFIHSYVASKIETKEKSGRESNDEIKIID